MCRLTRVAALLGATFGLAACSARPLSRTLPCGADPSGGVAPNRDVDLLFMIDNSSFSKGPQNQLIEAFPTFLQALAGPSGMPNLHIAVVSSDMGAGTGTGGCAGNGQAGVFQWGGPNATCTATTDGTRFLSNTNGTANYTGDVSTLFPCVAALGETGCGFEQPLLSIAHALGADNFAANGVPQPPVENQGFLRPGAYLVIVMLTNEDDCSAPQGAASDLFPRAGDGSNLTSPLGPPTGYRCNELGHLCGSPPAPPPRLAPNGEATTITLDDCIPNDDGRLIRVADFDAAMRALKVDPARQMLVAGITAVYPDPAADPPPAYGVAWSKAPMGNELWPKSWASCRAPNGLGGHAAVRISDWVRRFGPHGILQSICTDDLRPAMQQIGAAIADLITAANEPSGCVN